MTCREVEKIADLFIDGELEARVMRAVAMHVTRCAPCEALIQRLERLQDVISDTFHEAVSAVDFSRFWTGVNVRVGELRGSRLGAFGRRVAGARMLTPARTAAIAAAIVLLLGAYTVLRGVTAASARPNNQVRIDALASDADAVAVMSEPQSNTTVIWVTTNGEARPR